MLGREAAESEALGSLSLNSRFESPVRGLQRPSPATGGSAVRLVVFLEIRDSTLKARQLLPLRGGFAVLATLRSRGCASSTFSSSGTSRAGEPRAAFMAIQRGSAGGFDGAMQVPAAVRSGSVPVVSAEVFKRVITHETCCRINGAWWVGRGVSGLVLSTGR